MELTKKDYKYEARLARKYEGLKWRDLDNGNVLVSSHPLQMYYWKEKRAVPPDYYLIGRLEGYNSAMDPGKQNDDVWDYWERNSQLYESIIEYYKENPDDSIVIYEEGGSAESKGKEEEQQNMDAKE